MVVLTRIARTASATALAACALLAAGCTGPRQTQPPVDPATLSDQGFLHYLAEVPVVTTDEAYRAMLVLADGADASKSFEQRRDTLVSRGIVNPDWNLQPQNVIDRGAAAAMVCKLCKLWGGVNRLTFGALGLGDRRYAVRELVYRDMMAFGPDYSGITGGEMVALVTKADEYMAKQKIYETTEIELGSEGQVPPQPPASAAAPATGAAPTAPGADAVEVSPAASAPR
jgi:hypothetical protein